ncbi:hypothetical protein BDV93DRAFT_565570 [Ceratobasidium sp. AG-I]|nr:hypothetical protein BDV93DRAFT_565570 [Ceratobasidium sp. AG-I]
MFGIDRLKAARVAARKSKRAVSKVLGLDVLICNCSRCRGRKQYRQKTVKIHLAQYGHMDDDNDDNENDMSANYASSSAQKGGSGTIDESASPRYYGENASLGGLSAPRSRHSTHSPATLTRSPMSPIHLNNGSGAGSSHHSGGASPAQPVVHAPPPSPRAGITREISGGYLAASGRLRAHDTRAYTASSSSNGASFEARDLLLLGQRPCYQRLATPSATAPSSPQQLLPPPRLPHLFPDYLPDSSMRPVSPVPSTGSSLDFVEPVPQLRSRFASPNPAFGSEDTGPAGSQGRVVDAEEDRRFYAGLFGEDFDRDYNDPLPFSNNGEPEGLNHSQGGPKDDDDDDDDDDEDDDDDDDPEQDEPNGMDVDAPGPRVEDQDPLIGDDPDPDDPDAELAAAFRGPSRLRNIYIRTFLESAFHGVTRDSIRNTLLSHKLSLESAVDAGELAPEISDCLPTMAQSLRSLERRLGLNTDELIITFTLCQKCGTRYSPEQINNARNPGCSRYWNGLRCDNPLYDESTLYDGVLKRTPRKSFPYVSIIRLIERLLMRPGMKELMQHWRRNDNPVDNEPLSKDDWLETKGPQEIFGDISQAWGWRAEPVGLTRRWDAENNSYGDTVDDDGPISLASRPLGLSLSLNHDGRVNLHVFIAYISLYLWRRFQSFSNGKYSVDGVYVVINNLPFYLRHLIENTMLVIVIPGPNGPTDFEFDQIMEPLVDDILRLEQGQDLLVHNMELNRPEEQLVHAHLSVGVLDYIARMKTCGHAGTASERNFCLYCKTKRSFIVAREGYNNLALRDPVEVLDQKHAWLRTPTERRERMRKQTGVTFTEFDRLPVGVRSAVIKNEQYDAFDPARQALDALDAMLADDLPPFSADAYAWITAAELMLTVTIAGAIKTHENATPPKIERGSESPNGTQQFTPNHPQGIRRGWERIASGLVSDGRRMWSGSVADQAVGGSERAGWRVASHDFGDNHDHPVP